MLQSRIAWISKLQWLKTRCTFFEGTSTGILGTVFYLVVVRYFALRRQLALGLSQAGSAIGTLILAPVVQFLIDSCGWRGALLLLGGITLNSTAASALYRPIVIQADLEEETKGKESYCTTLAKSAGSVVCISNFWLAVIISIIIYGAWRVYLSFMIPFSEEFLTVDSMKSSLLLSAYSIASIPSRIIFGAIADRKDVNIVWVLIITQLVTTVITAILWLVETYSVLMVDCLLHSLLMGTIHVLYVPIMINIVGETNFKWAMSLTGFLNSLIGSGIVPLAGIFL